MTFADDIKATLTSIRSIPGQMGLRPYSVKTVVRCAHGDLDSLSLESGYTETETEITEAGGYPPKVRQLSDEERTHWGFSRGSYRVGPITPAHTGGGTELSALMREEDWRDKLFVVLTGPEWPNGARFRVVDVESDRALHYTLTVVSETD